MLEERVGCQILLPASAQMSANSLTACVSSWWHHSAAMLPAHRWSSSPLVLSETKEICIIQLIVSISLAKAKNNMGICLTIKHTSKILSLFSKQAWTLNSSQGHAAPASVMEKRISRNPSAWSCGSGWRGTVNYKVAFSQVCLRKGSCGSTQIFTAPFLER